MCALKRQPKLSKIKFYVEIFEQRFLGRRLVIVGERNDSTEMFNFDSQLETGQALVFLDKRESLQNKRKQAKRIPKWNLESIIDAPSVVISLSLQKEDLSSW